MPGSSLLWLMALKERLQDGVPPRCYIKSHLNISKGEEKSNDINRLAVIQELQANIEAVGTVESAVNTAVTTTSQGNPLKLEKLT